MIKIQGYSRGPESGIAAAQGADLSARGVLSGLCEWLDGAFYLSDVRALRLRTFTTRHSL